MSDLQDTPAPSDTNATKGPLHLSRRQLLVATAVTGVAGTGLLIGFTLHARDSETPQLKKGRFTPNAWLHIDADNTVTVTVARSEAGQGVLTALAMLVAEELDADWSHVRAVQAPSDSQYGNQRTTGSGSVAGSFQKLRFAGTQARALLVAAAAHVWGVNASTCRTEKGAVLHPSSGRRLSYGQLAGTAATLRVSLGELKSPEQFRLIGTRAPRLDTPATVDGSAVFGLDMRIPDMLFATVARAPVPGGTLVRFDATRAQAIPGVRKIVRVDNGVAVIAEHTWAAIAGRRALETTWNEGANANLASATIRRQLMAKTPRPSAASGASRVVEAVYETPYQGHTPMEPLNCTVRLQSDSCEVWVGTQDPQGVQNAAAQASGVAYDHVKVHIPAIGGAFGRRASSDVVTEAVNVAKAAGNPVQVVWTREDDLQNGFYRPGAWHQLRATLDASGKPQSWQHGVAAQSMGDGVGAGAELPYAIPSIRVTGVDVTLGVPVTIWRGAEYSYMTFAVESFIDEIAATAGADPYTFRRGLLNDNTRLRAVLDLAASKSGWGTPLPAGQGRGMAAYVYSNSDTYVAEVAEASVSSDGTVRVHRVVCAVDCGLVINPAIAESQVEGSIVQGLSAALKSEITFARGRVQQTNFDSYPLLRLNEMPAVETYFVASGENPSGLGEPALPPIAPAVANAIFAATGKRVRRLPIRPDDLH
ncbi:MAG TPA: xanthine dehydrogenase family protein molybdopterin-binding subunit [Ktedonobacterales bacterium]|nr:xanthine dehydrogenase family protein molybdopterin-binding subunit [Ktedonobacterales bacterium]